MSNKIKHFYEFGEFRFDAEKRVLWREGAAVPIPPKASEVLAVLIEERGDLVERDRLVDEVWHNTFVEEGNLNNAISSLRKVLGENGIIQTVPRRGYRFTAEVREVAEPFAPDLVIERRTISNTFIESSENDPTEEVRQLPPKRRWLLSSRVVFIAFVLLFSGSAAVAWYFSGSANASRRNQIAAIRSLAVLPLNTFSENSADEELRMRITDALITRLGRMDNIVVRPTNSVLRFAGKNVDVAKAGQDLNVDAVIDGRVQEENGRLRVTIQLIKVPEREQLWSEQFDGRSGEILNLQDAIAQGFREAMQYGPAVDRSQPSVSNEAYEAYLKGRYLWNQRKKESYYAALEYFERSVKIDPSFALGYTGISDCYHLLQQRNVFSTKDAFDKAEYAARRALELDPQLAESHVSMGSVAFVRYSRWTEAEAYYRRAIELNPNIAEPYARLGMLLNAWSRFDEAHDVLKRAETLDPTSVNNAIYLGANYYFSKQLDRAEAHFKRILQFAPGTERAHFFLERIYEIQGKHDLAVEHALKEREIFRPESVEPLRKSYAEGGITAFWKKQVEMYLAESEMMRGLENHIASRYVLLGEVENANQYIEINLKNFGTMHNYGRVDPLFDPMRQNPRFVDLMNRYGPII
jgi:DNA-binding winged helix-turn-helix (wHTH) protein/TolB-like protein/lipopolysaccharide biosynthesis regulator YciM